MAYDRLRGCPCHQLARRLGPTGGHGAWRLSTPRSDEYVDRSLYVGVAWSRGSRGVAKGRAVGGWCCRDITRRLVGRRFKASVGMRCVQRCGINHEAVLCTRISLLTVHRRGRGLRLPAPTKLADPGGGGSYDYEARALRCPLCVELELEVSLSASLSAIW